MSNTARIPKSTPFPLFCIIHKSIPQLLVHPVLNIASDTNINGKVYSYLSWGTHSLWSYTFPISPSDPPCHGSPRNANSIKQAVNEFCLAPELGEHRLLSCLFIMMTQPLANIQQLILWGKISLVLWDVPCRGCSEHLFKKVSL